MNTILAAVLLFTSFLILGCSSSVNSLPGTYLSDSPSLFDKIECKVNGINGWIAGSTLVLEKDSTFIYTTCGNIMMGKWSREEDSLSLHVESNRWRNDSLQIHGSNGKWPQVPEHPIKFAVANRELRNLLITIAGNRRKVAVNKMVLIEE